MRPPAAGPPWRTKAASVGNLAASMHFCFVSTSRGSYFMTELLAAIASATETTGSSVELVFDRFPRDRDDGTYVAIPHEFEAWGDPSGCPTAEQRTRTIALCTENPGTEWFDATYRLVSDFAAAVSINRSSAAELRRRGVRCEHLQLGYCERWDTWHGETRQRPTDVLYLGAADPRRDPLLAGIGAGLWAHECQFLVPPLEPRTGPRPDFLREDDKYHRLGEAKILLNLHRTTSTALEWMRFIEAICNGCVVVSEPCVDSAPLVAGEHFVEATPERMAGVVGELLNRPERLRQLQAQAYDFIRDELPMDRAGQRLAELAGELPRQPPGVSAPSGNEDPRPHRGAPGSAGGSEASSDTADASDVDWTGATAGTAGLRASLAGATRKLGRRRPRRHAAALQSTPSYAAARPRVSVLSVVENAREARCIELLQSVAASDFDSLEILILAGSPRASGRDGLGDLLRAHPACPIARLQHDEGGLAAGRNRLAGLARGEYLLVPTTEGGVFPSTVERLVAALDADPAAFFCYPMSAACERGSSVGLRGSLPWEPQRLRRENWIDGPVLMRRARLATLGGYSQASELRGLEDFDLWCRCAAAGGHGVHVPQVLGWHPASDNAPPHDVASLSPEIRELMQERCPSVFDDALTADRGAEKSA